MTSWEEIFTNLESHNIALRRNIHDFWILCPQHKIYSYTEDTYYNYMDSKMWDVNIIMAMLVNALLGYCVYVAVITS